jgi:hypothetical protein
MRDMRERAVGGKIGGCGPRTQSSPLRTVLGTNQKRRTARFRNKLTRMHEHSRRKEGLRFRTHFILQIAREARKRQQSFLPDGYLAPLG